MVYFGFIDVLLTVAMLSIRISIVHYDSFDWKLKDGADINRALDYF